VIIKGFSNLHRNKENKFQTRLKDILLDLHFLHKKDILTKSRSH
jgi:hypothetical protein